MKASIPTHLPRVDEFVEYFEATWLVGNFTAQQWNVHGNNSYWTNNHTEGWHSRLKWVVNKAHHNIYEFIEVIQQEKAATEILLQLDSGAQPPTRAIWAITKDQKIQELKDRFSLNTISLGESHTNIWTGVQKKSVIAVDVVSYLHWMEPIESTCHAGILRNTSAIRDIPFLVYAVDSAGFNIIEVTRYSQT